MDDVYKFHIEAYTPETIPLHRLAEYMQVLAEVLGEKDRVHFAGLERGSTRIVSRVEREAVPKVRDNLQRAATGDGRAEASQALKKANDMLRADNATGELQRSGNNVLKFPGRLMARPVRLGPFNQAVERQGTLVRIGGQDKSAHAMLEDAAGEIWSFEVTRELAIDLAHYLFGPPMRLSGSGRFFRDEEGLWRHTVLKATSYELLDPRSLSDVVESARKVMRNGLAVSDPLRALQELRGDDEAQD